MELCGLRIHLQNIEARILSCSGVGGVGRGPSRRAGPTAGTNHRPDRASGCGGVAKSQDTTIELDGDSSFVELDGHSMIQLGLANMLCATFSRCILGRTVIEVGTLRELAQAIDALGASSSIQNVDEQPLNKHRLSLIEHGSVATYALYDSSSAFKVSVVSIFIPGNVNTRRLAEAWNVMLAVNRI